MTYTKDRPVKHIKTGNIYYLLDFVVNATNGDENDNDMALYMNEQGLLFVRNTEEFWEKFEEVYTVPEHLLNNAETKVCVPLKKLVTIDAACAQLHINPYCVNEGSDGNALYEISVRDANKWGLI